MKCHFMMFIFLFYIYFSQLCFEINSYPLNIKQKINGNETTVLSKIKLSDEVDLVDKLNKTLVNENYNLFMRSKNDKKHETDLKWIFGKMINDIRNKLKPNQNNINLNPYQNNNNNNNNQNINQNYNNNYNQNNNNNQNNKYNQNSNNIQNQNINNNQNSYINKNNENSYINKNNQNSYNNNNNQNSYNNKNNENSYINKNNQNSYINKNNQNSYNNNNNQNSYNNKSIKGLLNILKKHNKKPFKPHGTNINNSKENQEENQEETQENNNEATQSDSTNNEASTEEKDNKNTEASSNSTATDSNEQEPNNQPETIDNSESDTNSTSTEPATYVESDKTAQETQEETISQEKNEENEGNSSGALNDMNTDQDSNIKVIKKSKSKKNNKDNNNKDSNTETNEATLGKVNGKKPSKNKNTFKSKKKKLIYKPYYNQTITSNRTDDDEGANLDIKNKSLSELLKIYMKKKNLMTTKPVYDTKRECQFHCEKLSSIFNCFCDKSCDRYKDCCTLSLPKCTKFNNRFSEFNATLTFHRLRNYNIPKRKIQKNTSNLNEKTQIKFRRRFE